MTTTEIRLNSLEYNFRGQRKNLVFHDGINVIAGRNGSGKSTAMNAFIWLLCGYDIENQQNNNLFDNTALTDPENPKTVNVTASFSVNGGNVKLSKAARQVWKRKSGETEYSRAQDEYRYFKDDLEITATQYKEFVDARFGKGDYLKLMLNTDYWGKLTGISLRPFFIKLIGDINPDDFKGNYSSILPTITELGTEKARKTFNNRANDLASSITKTSADIEANQDQLPDISGLESAKKEIASLEAERESVDAQISGLATGNDEYVKRRKAEEDAIAEAEASFRKACNDLASDRDEKIRQTQSEWEEVKRKNRQTEDEKLQLESQRHSWERRKEDLTYHLDAEKAKREDKLKEVDMISKRHFEGICPACGSNLAGVKRDEALSAFRTKNAIDHDTAVSEGKRIRANMDSYAAQIAEADKRMAEIDERLADLKRINTVPYKDAYEEACRLNADWKYDKHCKKLYENIERLKASRTPEPINIDIVELQKRKGDINVRLRELYGTLGLEKIYNDVQNKIATLESMLKQAVAAKASNERMKKLVDDYVKEQSEIIRVRANKLFDHVVIEMEEPNKSGDPKPCCKLRIDGVVDTANTASRVIIGAEVSRAFQRHFGLSLPLFIDRAESINEDNIPHTDGQLILLKVDDGDFRQV